MHNKNFKIVRNILNTLEIQANKIILFQIEKYFQQGLKIKHKKKNLKKLQNKENFL